ncbi:calumenin-like [Populus alba x Populus x berolinensis]|nr:calumenin-like [Populus alba x Populus x berolinensis]
MYINPPSTLLKSSRETISHKHQLKLIRYLIPFKNMGFAVNNPKGEEGNNCLTKEQLKSFFLKHDNNHDYHLSRKELRQAFDELGAFSARYRAARGLSHADADKDGQIDMVELDDLVNYAYKLGYTIKPQDSKHLK